MPNQYVNKVVLSNGTTLIDLTGDTITIGDAVVGVTLHLASGEVVTGTLDDFTGATSSTAGAHGLVPAPAAGEQNYVLTGTGDWASPDVFVTPSASANSLTVKVGHYQETVTFDAADTTNAGLMSAADKAKLDGIGTPGITRLWGNASPASSFAAKTVTMSGKFANYDLILFEYRFSTSSVYYYTRVFRAQKLEDNSGTTNSFTLDINASSYNRTGGRNFSIKRLQEPGTDDYFSQVVFAAAGYNGSSSDNSYCIPTDIYGIKL